MFGVNNKLYPHLVDSEHIDFSRSDICLLVSCLVCTVRVFLSPISASELYVLSPCPVLNLDARRSVIHLEEEPHFPTHSTLPRRPNGWFAPQVAREGEELSC
jgi:hypothetical protein